MWGDLASCKTSLTPRPNSQGWASYVLCVCYVYICGGGRLVWVGFLSFSFFALPSASVLYTCIFNLSPEDYVRPEDLIDEQEPITVQPISDYHSMDEEDKHPISEEPTS